MKKPVKIIGAIVLALLAAGVAAASVLSPLAVKATTLEAAAAKVTFTEQGIYVYNRSMTVYPQISGEVLEVKASTGRAVKKGDVLAVVSANDYEYQIKELESGIAGYQAQINNLYTQESENKNTLYASRESLLGQIAEIDAAFKDIKKGAKTLERQLELQDSIIAQNRSLVSLLRQDYSDARDFYSGDFDSPELRAAREAYNQAQNALDASLQQYEQMKNSINGTLGMEVQRDSLEAQLKLVDERIGKSGTWAMQQYYNAMIEGAKSNIESMSEKLGQANITAPMDGVVDKLPIEDANVISQASAVAVICAEPVVEVYVPIREIDGVHIGDAVELIISRRIGDETFTGTVTLIEEEAETRISALGVEERKVRVLIKPQEDKLRIGYGMDVKFTVFEQQNAIVVPKTAVFEKDGKDMVWLIENGAAVLRPVEKGIETRDGYAINSGLSSGDMIVTDANTDGLKEGKNIKPE